jgi:ATP-dependent DNA helicase DinG
MDQRLGKANNRWDIERALPPMKRTRHRAEAEAFLRHITET